MEREDKQQPLTDGALMEYIVHGEFAYKKSDINGTFGAWWVPLRKMVKELGKEEVEQKLWRSWTTRSSKFGPKRSTTRTWTRLLMRSRRVDSVVLWDILGYPGISWDILGYPGI